jgi:group I intron endonuclease
MAGTIYLLENQQNGKRYVGQTIRIKRRLHEHKHHNRSGVLSKAIAKYGWAAFKHTILEEDIVTENLNAREKFWIAELQTKAPNGYNLTDGGKQATTYSDEFCHQAGIRAKERLKNPIYLAKWKKAAAKGLKNRTAEDQGKCAKATARLWQVTYPSGQSEIILNLAEFCRKHKLNQSCMSGVALGKYKHHKKFLCRCVDPKPHKSGFKWSKNE